MTTIQAQKPRVPAGLRSRGKAFWRQIVTDFELTRPGLETLRETCRALDELDLLQSAIDTDGATVVGSAGQPRAHPAFAEMRATRLSLNKLLTSLALPDDAPSRSFSAVGAKARRAANARWRGHADGAGPMATRRPPPEVPTARQELDDDPRDIHLLESDPRNFLAWEPDPEDHDDEAFVP